MKEKQLVFTPENIFNEPFTYSSIIAEGLKRKHHSITKLIQRHEKHFERLGILRLIVEKISDGRGRGKKIYSLNKKQTAYLFTLLQNTPEVLEFNLRFVEQFFKMEKQLNLARAERELSKIRRSKLTDAIKLYVPDSEHKKFQYRNYTDLVYKKVFGQSKKQFLRLRDIPTGENLRNYISMDEMLKIEQYETLICFHLEQGRSYTEIKELINQ